MNFYLIIFFLIFPVTLNGLDRNKPNGIDVLGTLASKNITCNFQNLFLSTNASIDEHQLLINDLTKYCSISQSPASYHLLCRIILIELEIGCLLSNKSYLPSFKYSSVFTPKEICSMNRISFTNKWIWQKLTSDEKEEIGSTSVYLCQILTSTNATLRLARFFYKLAPKIRRIDSENKTIQDNNGQGNSVFNKIQMVGDLPTEKINNTNAGLFEQPKRSFRNKYSKLHNQTLQNKTNGNVLDLKQEQGNLKKVNEVEGNPGKEKEGLPLGRAREEPAREQLIQRPKPKALEIDSVFKPKEDEEDPNWIGGKHNVAQVKRSIDNDNNRLNQIKSENNPSVISPSGKRKSFFKLKLKRDPNDNNGLLYNLKRLILILILFIISIYLILRNKNKIFGLFIEMFNRRRGIYHRRLRLSQSN